MRMGPSCAYLLWLTLGISFQRWSSLTSLTGAIVELRGALDLASEVQSAPPPTPPPAPPCVCSFDLRDGAETPSAGDWSPLPPGRAIAGSLCGVVLGLLLGILVGSWWCRIRREPRLTATWAAASRPARPAVLTDQRPVTDGNFTSFAAERVPKQGLRHLAISASDL